MIEFLHERRIIDQYGTCYGLNAPSHFEMMEKINEIIEVVNKLQEHYDKERTAWGYRGYAKTLYSEGLYIKYDMNGLWYCGYNNSVFHASDRDLLIALDMLRINLKLQGYVD